MSHRFIIFSTIFIISLFGIFGYINTLRIHSIGKSFKNEMLTKQEHTLLSIIPQIRHLLITGNEREANRILRNWQKAGIFKSYKIIREGYSSNNYESKIIIPIQFSNNGETWGSVLFDIDETSTINYSNRISSQLLINTAGTLLILFIFIGILLIILWRTSKGLTFTLEQYLNNEATSDNFSLSLIWKPLLKRMKRIAVLSNEINESRRKILLAEQIDNISKQVSHDIRSPLAALNVALEDISSLPEKNRLILRMSIQRIQDIANNLLKSSHEKEITNTFIYPLIEEILSEKRTLYKSLSHISIEGTCKDKNNIFAKVNPSELKQILSNLVNNSVEAIDKPEGMITLKLYREDNNAIIEISDNGKGIPNEVLNQLGKVNISYGKNKIDSSGFGYGVKSAFDTVLKWEGGIEFFSNIGSGTVVRLKLPLSSRPDWFTHQISFKPNQTVIILDDDQEIHYVWEKKLEQLLVNRHHFFNAKKVKDWIVSNPDSDFLLLSDYELIGDKSTGLSLIKSLGIQGRSILVTSHYEEIVKNESSLKVIPKNVVPSIEVYMSKT